MLDLNRVYNFYYKTCFFPPFLKKIKIDSVLRLLCIIIANIVIRCVKIKSIGAYSPKHPNIIVSLTSFPARIENVWKTIISLLNQCQPPDRIILWLSDKQFSSLDSLPNSLKRLTQYGLDIRFVPEDIRSHKKYYYAFREFPKDYVLLVDDDMLYPSDMIATLTKNMSPDKVHCSYGSIIKYDKDGHIIKYKDWKPVLGTYDGNDFFFGSGGGTLLMPSALCQDVLDIEKALDLCPTADDIWLNTMCRISKLKIEKVRNSLIFPSIIINKEALHNVNVGECRNDVQLDSVAREYPLAYAKKQL